MWTGMNLCTAILPEFNFDEVLEIATMSGFKGIELRVNHDHHIALGDLLTSGQFISAARPTYSLIMETLAL